MTAAVFLPAVAFFAVAKPQASIPVVGAAPSRSTPLAAAVGAVVLIALSFYFLPGWPREWWHLLGETSYFIPPITRAGGVAVAVVLIRWRRSEAWLLLILACLPQTWYPYNGLLLLVVAATYREACFLSLFSSAAWMLVFLFVPGEMRSAETRETWGLVLLATSYLPAVIIILRRPNEGPRPWWLDAVTGFSGARLGSSCV